MADPQTYPSPAQKPAVAWHLSPVIRHTLALGTSAMLSIFILAHYDDLLVLFGRQPWTAAEHARPISQLYFAITGQHPTSIEGWTARVENTDVGPDGMIHARIDLGDGIVASIIASDALGYQYGDSVRVWGRFDKAGLAVTAMQPLNER
jgi:hypothetical protein